MLSDSAASGAVRWLSLAAAPTFAGMALLSALQGTGPDALCAATGDAWPLTGMVAMYLLMSLFHLAPWLRLAAGLRRYSLNARYSARSGQT